MSYQEKENIVNIFSALFISIIYSLLVYQRHLQGQFDLTQDFSKWGIIFLIFVIAFILLAVGMPIWGIFVAFVVSGVISELVDNFSQIYYNRKGI